MLHTHTHTHWNIIEYYSAIKEKKILPLSTRWMSNANKSAQINTQSEISHTEKDTILYGITYKWNFFKS